MPKAHVSNCRRAHATPSRSRPSALSVGERLTAPWPMSGNAYAGVQSFVRASPNDPAARSLRSDLDAEQKQSNQQQSAPGSISQKLCPGITTRCTRLIELVDATGAALVQSLSLLPKRIQGAISSARCANRNQFLGRPEVSLVEEKGSSRVTSATPFCFSSGCRSFGRPSVVRGQPTVA